MRHWPPVRRLWSPFVDETKPGAPSVAAHRRPTVHVPTLWTDIHAEDASQVTYDRPHEESTSHDAIGACAARVIVFLWVFWY